jgi:integrase
MAQETWPGGYVHRDAHGRPTYVIRRRLGGRRITVSTRRRTLQAAMAELARFESDPEGYTPLEGQRVTLDDALAVDFLTASQAKGNTPGWVRDQKASLLWWQEQLGSVDLRKASVARMQDALRDAPGRRTKIETIKALYSWLVEQGRIRTTEDPTFRVLKVPAPRPEQWEREKAIPRESHALWLTLLPDPWRSALVVLAATGWHVKELERFAAGGEINGAVLELPRTKRGRPHRTRVSEDVLPAASLLRERGLLRNDALINTIRRIEKRHLLLGGPALPKLDPGSYRHTVATWAIEAGEDVATVARFLDHASGDTTLKFYATHAVPVRPKGIG